MHPRSCPQIPEEKYIYIYKDEILDKGNEVTGNRYTTSMTSVTLTNNTLVNQLN